jgi:hypothetical protein
MLAERPNILTEDRRMTLLSLDDTPDSSRRGSPRGYLLLNVGGRLLFGFGMTLAAAEVQPWEVVLATTPVTLLARTTG